MNTKHKYIGFGIGYLLLILGAIVHISGAKMGFYIFGVGTLINTLFRVRLLPKSDDIRIRRLNNQHFIIVLALLATAYLMYANHSAWAVPLLIAGVIELYLTYRYPKTKD